MIKKQCLLNDIFHNRNQQKDEGTRQNNITKFIECFNNSTGKRNRQIRILQIGNSCGSKADKKNFLKSQSIKNNHPSALLNNQILFRSQLNEPRETYFFVEGVSHNEHKRASSTIKNADDKNRIGSAPKHIFAQKMSPYQTKGWSIRNKNLEELPSTFYIKNNGRCTNSASPQKRTQKSSCQIENNKFTQPGSPVQTKNKSCKSVNLLNKIKAIEQYRNQGVTTINIGRKPLNFQNKKSPQQLMEEERKVKLEIKKQISQDYAKPFNPPTNISAFAYAVYEPSFSAKVQKKKVYEKIIEINSDMYGMEENVRVKTQKKFPHSHKVLISQNSRTQVEVASLTKIMTCILTIQLCERLNVDSTTEQILIGKFESEIGGTSAEISAGEIYKLEDLYYGLMLPSGNDASVAMAVWGGRMLLTRQEKDPCKTYKKKECYNRFIMQMNNLSKKIGMQKTTYANSHGLANPQNKSCAYDLCILCEYAMSNAKFRNITSARVHCATIKYENSEMMNNGQIHRTSKIGIIQPKQQSDDEMEEGEDIDLNLNEQEFEKSNEQLKQYGYKTVQWQNTHKLLQQKPQQYIGIKTGITNNAGPCLASCLYNKSGRYFIIIVLNCEKMSMRFKDTQNLKKWAFQRERIISPKKRSKNVINLVKGQECEMMSMDA